MTKKILLPLLLFLFVAIPAFALEGFDVQLEKAQCDPGEPVRIALSLPAASGVGRIELHLNGEPSEVPVSIAPDGKSAAAHLVLQRSGTAALTFMAYDEIGAALGEFPDKPVELQVSLAPPVTTRAYVAEHDMATLAALLPETNGISIREYGFDYGTAPDALDTRVKGNKAYEGAYNRQVTGLTQGTTYYYRPYCITPQGELQGDVGSFTTLAKSQWSAQDAIFATPQERYQFLFDDDTRCPRFENAPKGYGTREEVEAHLVQVTVPVWRSGGGTSRTASTARLTINRKLAASVEAIFQDIFDLELQFPIHYLHGYSYRRINGLRIFEGTTFMSHHSFGTAIDINYHENLFYPPGQDNRNKNDPYTIPQEVIDVFEKYGWSWGGYFLEGIDAMHFQYLGLDLMTEVDYVTPPMEDVRG